MNETIALTGFMGCGKSTVGKTLSSLVGSRFTDLDDFIEERSDRRISEIFSTDGEEGFRRLERTCLSDVFNGATIDTGLPIGTGSRTNTGLVLSLGGGTLNDPDCAELIKKNAVCIYLRASAKVLSRNLLSTRLQDRPLLQCILSVPPKDREEALTERISELLEQRRETYEKAADAIVDVDGKSPLEIAEEIVRLSLPARVYP